MEKQESQERTREMYFGREQRRQEQMKIARQEVKLLEKQLEQPEEVRDEWRAETWKWHGNNVNVNAELCLSLVYCKS